MKPMKQKQHTRILRLLRKTGHLKYPFGARQVVPHELRKKEQDNVRLDDPDVQPAIRSAIASYQDFMIQNLDPLCLEEHGRPAQCDGQIGPATMRMMELPRCGCRDYDPNVKPAVGKGNWPRCHDIGDFHAATVHVNEGGMPSFLKPVFDEVWQRTVAAYDEVGLRFIRVDDNGANIEFSFVRGSRGWIGLAIVGQGQSCGSQIWCKYLASYKPSNVVREWSTLVMHELGHNAGLQHSRGGVMNPSVIRGLPASWTGDPSLPILKRYFGGEPIDKTPGVGEYWIKYGLESNRGRHMWLPLHPPIKVEEE